MSGSFQRVSRGTWNVPEVLQGSSGEFQGVSRGFMAVPKGFRNVSRSLVKYVAGGFKGVLIQV